MFDVTIVETTHGEADIELLIREVSLKAVIGLHQCAVPGRDIHAMDIEVTLIAFIVPNQELAGKVARSLLNVTRHCGTWRQRPDIAGLKIDPPSPPVLITALIPEEHDMAVVVHPDDPRTDIAVGHVRHGPRPVDIIKGNNPKVEHAVDGCPESDLHAVRTEAHDASFQVCKYQAARKQVEFMAF
jgi:hypothetical protein